MTVYRQADPRWSSHALGESRTTIGKSGCLLTCLAMAHERILGGTLMPPEANELALEAGAFYGSGLIVERAAPALGLVLVDRVGAPGRATPTLEQMLALTREALDAGGVAVLHVDHDARAGGDHFILVYSRAGDGYLAADPAPGTNIVLDEALSGTSLWGTTVRSYTPVGVMFIGRGEG